MPGTTRKRKPWPTQRDFGDITQPLSACASLEWNRLTDEGSSTSTQSHESLREKEREEADRCLVNTTSDFAPSYDSPISCPPTAPSLPPEKPGCPPSASRPSQPTLLPGQSPVGPDSARSALPCPKDSEKADAKAVDEGGGEDCVQRTSSGKTQPSEPRGVRSRENHSGSGRTQSLSHWGLTVKLGKSLREMWISDEEKEEMKKEKNKENRQDESRGYSPIKFAPLPGNANALNEPSPFDGRHQDAVENGDLAEDVDSSRSQHTLAARGTLRPTATELGLASPSSTERASSLPRPNSAARGAALPTERRAKDPGTLGSARREPGSAWAAERQFRVAGGERRVPDTARGRLYSGEEGARDAGSYRRAREMTLGADSAASFSHLSRAPQDRRTAYLPEPTSMGYLYGNASASRCQGNDRGGTTLADVRAMSMVRMSDLQLANANFDYSPWRRTTHAEEYQTRKAGLQAKMQRNKAANQGVGGSPLRFKPAERGDRRLQYQVRARSQIRPPCTKPPGQAPSSQSSVAGTGTSKDALQDGKLNDSGQGKDRELGAGQGKSELGKPSVLPGSRSAVPDGGKTHVASQNGAQRRVDHAQGSHALFSPGVEISRTKASKTLDGPRDGLEPIPERRGDGSAATSLEDDVKPKVEKSRASRDIGQHPPSTGSRHAKSVNVCPTAATSPVKSRPPATRTSDARKVERPCFMAPSDNVVVEDGGTAALAAVDSLSTLAPSCEWGSGGDRLSDLSISVDSSCLRSLVNSQSCPVESSRNDLHPDVGCATSHSLSDLRCDTSVRSGQSSLTSLPSINRSCVTLERKSYPLMAPKENKNLKFPHLRPVKNARDSKRERASLCVSLSCSNLSFAKENKHRFQVKEERRRSPHARPSLSSPHQDQDVCPSKSYTSLASDSLPKDPSKASLPSKEECRFPPLIDDESSLQLPSQHSRRRSQNLGEKPRAQAFHGRHGSVRGSSYSERNGGPGLFDNFRTSRSGHHAARTVSDVINSRMHRASRQAASASLHPGRRGGSHTSTSESEEVGHPRKGSSGQQTCDESDPDYCAFENIVSLREILAKAESKEGGSGSERDDPAHALADEPSPLEREWSRTSERRWGSEGQRQPSRWPRPNSAFVSMEEKRQAEGGSHGGKAESSLISFRSDGSSCYGQPRTYGTQEKRCSSACGPFGYSSYGSQSSIRHVPFVPHSFRSRSSLGAEGGLSTPWRKYPVKDVWANLWECVVSARESQNRQESITAVYNLIQQQKALLEAGRTRRRNRKETQHMMPIQLNSSSRCCRPLLYSKSTSAFVFRAPSGPHQRNRHARKKAKHKSRAKLGSGSHNLTGTKFGSKLRIPKGSARKIKTKTSRSSVGSPKKHRVSTGDHKGRKAKTATSGGKHRKTKPKADHVSSVMDQTDEEVKVHKTETEEGLQTGSTSEEQSATPGDGSATGSAESESVLTMDSEPRETVGSRASTSSLQPVRPKRKKTRASIESSAIEGKLIAASQDSPRPVKTKKKKKIKASPSAESSVKTERSRTEVSRVREAEEEGDLRRRTVSRTSISKLSASREGLSHPGSQRQPDLPERVQDSPRSDSRLKRRRHQRSAVEFRRNFHDPETWVQRLEVRSLSDGSTLCVVGTSCRIYGQKSPESSPKGGKGKRKSKKRKTSPRKVRGKPAFNYKLWEPMERIRTSFKKNVLEKKETGKKVRKSKRKRSKSASKARPVKTPEIIAPPSSPEDSSSFISLATGQTEQSMSAAARPKFLQLRYPGGASGSNISEASPYAAEADQQGGNEGRLEGTQKKFHLGHVQTEAESHNMRNEEVNEMGKEQVRGTQREEGRRKDLKEKQEEETDQYHEEDMEDSEEDEKEEGESESESESDARSEVSSGKEEEGEEGEETEEETETETETEQSETEQSESGTERTETEEEIETEEETQTEGETEEEIKTEEEDDENEEGSTEKEKEEEDGERPIMLVKISFNSKASSSNVPEHQQDSSFPVCKDMCQQPPSELSPEFLEGCERSRKSGALVPGVENELNELRASPPKENPRHLRDRSPSHGRRLPKTSLSR